jgi:hypothetical protein
MPGTLRVLEARHDVHLAHEALSKALVRGDVGVHDLDDHLAAVVELPTEVDLAHAAFAEEPLHFVASEEHRPLTAGGAGELHNVASTLVPESSSPPAQV